jgi:predicted RNA-binding protein YlxR (DUF448 family)
MIRLSLGADGPILVELSGKGGGRGAWLHPRPDCVRGATRGGLARSFKRKISVEPEELAAQIRAVAGRRIAGLLSAARGAQKLALGADEAESAVVREQAQLLLVACDAGSVANKLWVQGAVTSGRGLAWGTKDQIGQLLGRGPTAVVAVRDPGLSRALSWAIKCAQFPMPKPGA